MNVDDNRNGPISCREARRHGIAPVARDHAAYPFMRDRGKRRSFTRRGLSGRRRTDPGTLSAGAPGEYERQG